MVVIEKDCSVNVLGTEYKILFKDYSEDDEFKSGNAAGYCNMMTKEIIVCKFDSFPDFKAATELHVQNYYKELLRHEILHAFLYESGLDNETEHTHCWATDEEIIDWFAIQAPKIYSVYKKLDLV